MHTQTSTISFAREDGTGHSFTGFLPLFSQAYDSAYLPFISCYCYVFLLIITPPALHLMTPVTSSHSCLPPNDEKGTDSTFPPFFQAPIALAFRISQCSLQEVCPSKHRHHHVQKSILKKGFFSTNHISELDLQGADARSFLRRKKSAAHSCHTQKVAIKYNSVKFKLNSCAHFSTQYICNGGYMVIGHLATLYVLGGQDNRYLVFGDLKDQH